MRKGTLFVCFLLLCVLLLSGCSAQGTTGTPAVTEAPAPTEAPAADLVIPLSLLGEEPAFIDWMEGATAMQLIGLRDADGTVRLAFNTCQSCGGSPYAYFEYQGDGVMQCQNCGLLFRTATVGSPKAAGCNPVTISEFTVDAESVTVPAAVLQANVGRFTNWKVFE